MRPRHFAMVSSEPGTRTLHGPLTTRGLSVVLPAHNEEQVLSETVAQCVDVLSIVAPDYELIIVDDGSTDQTGAIADALADTNPHIRVLHNLSLIHI